MQPLEIYIFGGYFYGIGVLYKSRVNDDFKKGRVECTGYILANCMQPNFRQGVLRSGWSRMDGFMVITSQQKWKYIVQKRVDMACVLFPNITP
jgi:hypothetical protein